jgi:hypothetical protein
MYARCVFCVIVIVGLAGVAAQPAAAQNPFNINGVVPDTGIAAVPDPFGNVKELGVTNSANSNVKVGNVNTKTPPGVLDFTNPNGQVDLRAIWMKSAKATNGHQWLYFAWRRDANSGSGFIAFEFEQSQLSPSCVYTGADIDMVPPESVGETGLKNTCNPWQRRQAGDFMILWDQSGSALNITKRVFNGVAFGAPVALGTAVAAIGSCDGVANSTGYCGEAAIDLTVDVFQNVSGCQSFANIIPGTVTGNSDTADYKDTVFANFTPLSNCGSVKVIKATDPVGQTGSFPFTLARSSGNIKFDGTPSATDTLTSDGDSRTYPDLIAASNYTLTEGTQTSPWSLFSIVCVQGSNTYTITGGGNFTVVEGDLTTCTITNKRLHGNLTVIKHVINDDGGSAVAGNFTLALGDVANTIFAGSESPGNTFTFDEGYAFDVSESGPGGYALTGKDGDCSGTIVGGTTKVCTLTNDDIPAHLIVIKHVINDNGGQAQASAFTMTINGVTAAGGNSFAGAESPGVNKTLTSVGAFSVTEGSVTGYSQTSAVGCSGTIALGETKTCTIVNDDAKAAPGGATDQRVIMHDRISITSIRTGASDQASARVTFVLYSDAACAAAVGSEGPLPIAMNGTTGTASTASGVLFDPIVANPQAGTFRWRVTYTGDTFNEGFTTGCNTENTSVTLSPN